MSNGAMNNQATNNGAMSNGAMSNQATNNGAMSNGAMLLFVTLPIATSRIAH